MSYGGITATIPLGGKGLLTDFSPGELPPNALILANNVTMEDGLISKMRGSLKWNSSALSGGVVSLFDWHPNNYQQRLMAATSDGKIFRDTGDRLFSSGTAINSGLGTLTPNSMFVEGGAEVAGNNKKLFFFSAGLNQIQVLSGDGVTFADITLPAADWVTPNFPVAGLIHRNRLWAFQGQRAYASNTGDHENFTSSFLTQNIFPGEGGDVIGAFVFKGRLFSFKQGNFVYYLNESAADSTNWYWQKLAGNFGLAAPNAVIEAMNDMVAASSTGSVISYIATQKLGDVDIGDILAQAKVRRYIRDNTSLRGVPFMHALYYAEKQQAFFTYRGSSKTTNDRLLIIDIGDGAGAKISFADKDNPDCLALRKDIHGVERPMYGNSSGFIYFMDREDRDVGGVAYTGEFKTPHIDFRHLDPNVGHKNKLFDWMTVEFVPEGNWDLSADIFIDGIFTETLTFKMKNRDDGMDTFTLDTDKLGRDEAQHAPAKQLHGAGRRLSVRFYNSGLRQSFKLASFTVGFRLGNENATRI